LQHPFLGTDYTDYAAALCKHISKTVKTVKSV